MPGWRNGRRNGLKIRYPQGCEGSIPSPGITKTGVTAALPGVRAPDSRPEPAARPEFPEAQLGLPMQEPTRPEFQDLTPKFPLERLQAPGQPARPEPARVLTEWWGPARLQGVRRAQAQGTGSTELGTNPQGRLPAMAPAGRAPEEAAHPRRSFRVSGLGPRRSAVHHNRTTPEPGT